MILEFSISNFRSIKQETIFSLIAEPSRSKKGNISVKQLNTGEKIRVLKTAALYGANASGKTNVLKAFETLLAFVNNDTSNAGETIKFYQPFIFEESISKSPSNFKLTFIGPKDIKYIYTVAYNKEEVLFEELVYFPNGKETNIFSREANKQNDPLVHTARLGSSFKGKELKVFKNKLLLSSFGKEEPHEVISPIYVHLKKYSVLNTKRTFRIQELRKEILDQFTSDPWIQNNLNGIISASDLKINQILLDEATESEFDFPTDFPSSVKKTIVEEYKYHIWGEHDLYSNAEKVGVKRLSLDEESKGTNLLYFLGGKILRTLQNGDVLFVDELETSLHPNLCKMLIDLFQSEEFNTTGAQLIFTTHDVALLDKSLFRKDQIWITQKDDFGCTDFYSVQDFKEVREDTPFARWYMAGKFGGLPQIQAIETSINE